MNAVIHHIASGESFFTGAACLLLVCVVARPMQRWKSAVARLTGLLGMALVAVSATPLPLWGYAIWAICAIVFLFGFDARAALQRPKTERAIRISLALVSLTAVGCELPFVLAPSVPLRAARSLVVIGDSLSAGDFVAREEPWPEILSRQHELDVLNLSQNGATAKSATSKAEQIENAGAPLVLLEIGGNDVLGKTTALQFAEQLDALLQRLAERKSRVVMLELPLPPFYNEFGAIQRRLARRHDVVLIPKRYFASVIFSNGATIDGLHFTPAGHQRMADMVWSLVAEAFGASNRGANP